MIHGLFLKMVSEAFYTIGEMQPEVIPFNYMTFPAWICPQPKICFSLGSRTKKSCLPQDLLGTFLSHIPSHLESVHVYTDRSKTDSGVGAAVFSNEFTISVPFPYSASIFMAELYAIFFALVNIFSGASSCYTIFSDSKSVLQALSVLWTPHPLVREIQDLLYRLRARYKTVDFWWVPSHVGIPGNETVDAAAKVACTLPPMSLLLPHCDFYPILKRSL